MHVKVLNGTHKLRVCTYTQSGLSLFLSLSLSWSWTHSWLVNLGWYNFKVQAFNKLNGADYLSEEETEVTIAKALEYFNSTRHTILYNEDLIINRTVRTFS